MSRRPPRPCLHRHRLQRLAAALGATTLLWASACVDPRARFDDFVDRQRAQMGGDDTPDAGPGGPCERPSAEELRGLFVMTISTPLAPAKPLVTLLDVEAIDRADGVQVNMSQRVLAADDRATVVRGAEDLPEVLMTGTRLETGRFDFTAPTEANPLIDAPIGANVELLATVCSARGSGDPAAVLELVCGDVAGDLLDPFMMPLTGSTFAALRIADESAIPTGLPINCAGDLAEPL